jgi:hypothetical protein
MARKKRISKCYMCDAQGTTREHVPPRSFFPDPAGKNLVTVRSCEKHDNANSKDVEYVRNVIALQMGANAEGLAAMKATIRSFERNPNLIEMTARNLQPVTFGEIETGVFELDLPRIHQIMAGIANALYFKDYGVSFQAEGGSTSRARST